jgi:hypothetical protein
MRDFIDSFCFHLFGHSIIAASFGTESLTGVALGIVVALIGPPPPEQTETEHKPR